MGVLSEYDKGRTTKFIKTKDKRGNMWVMHKTKLGIFRETLEVVKDQGTLIEEDSAVPDEDGIY